MPTPPLEPWCDTRLKLAGEVVRQAGALALASFRDSALTVERKGVQDYVTAVDRAVEELIVDRLRAQFPGDDFLGEEGGRRSGSAGSGG